MSKHGVNPVKTAGSLVILKSNDLQRVKKTKNLHFVPTIVVLFVPIIWGLFNRLVLPSPQSTKKDPQNVLRDICWAFGP